MVLTSCKNANWFTGISTSTSKIEGSRIRAITSPSRANPRLSSNKWIICPFDRARKVVAAISASSCLIWARSRSFVTAATANCACLRAKLLFCDNRFWRAAKLLLSAVSAASIGKALFATKSSARSALRSSRATRCSAICSNAVSLSISAVISACFKFVSASSA